MILITGGFGFIGLHAARALLDLGETCVLTRHRTSGVPSFIGPELGKRVFVEQADITDSASFFEIGKRYPLTGTLHLAMPGSREADPFAKLRAHHASVENVLQAAHRWEVPRVCIASAIGVYSGVSDSLYREDAPLPATADNPFTAFKKSAEILASYIGRSAGFEVVNLRIAGVWGPLQQSAARLVVAPRLVHAAAKGELASFPNAAASPVLDAYDMCYVKDCARGIALLQTARQLNHGTYNIGSGCIVRNEEFAAALRRLLPDAKIALPEGRELNVRLDISRIRQDTGYEPEFDVDRGIADYVDWLKSGNEL